MNGKPKITSNFGIAKNTHKKIRANPQISRSKAGRRNLPMVKGSATASPRSLLTLRRMKAHSDSVKNFHDRCALSGKSTSKTPPTMAMMQESCLRV